MTTKRVASIPAGDQTLHRATTTTSIAVGAGTVTVTKPANHHFIVKQVVVTPGGNTTVDSITWDGTTTGKTASFDVGDQFGAPLALTDQLVVNVTNGGVGAEDSTVELLGYTLIDL